MAHFIKCSGLMNKPNDDGGCQFIGPSPRDTHTDTQFQLLLPVASKKNTFLVTWADQWHDCVSDDVLYHLVCAGNLLEKLKAPCMQLIRWQVLVSQAKDYSYASSILVYVIVCYNLVLLITPWIIVFIWSLAALLGSKRNYHVLEYIA